MAGMGAGYQVWLEFNIRQKFAQGLRQVQTHARQLQSSFTRMGTQSSDHLRRVQRLTTQYGYVWGNPRTMNEAQRSLTEIHSKQAKLVNSIALSQNAGRRAQMTTQLEALRITEREVQARKMALGYAEQQAAVQAATTAQQVRATTAMNVADQRRAYRLYTAERNEARQADLAQRQAYNQRRQFLGSVSSGAGRVGRDSTLAGLGIFAGLFASTQMAADYYQTALETQMGLSGPFVSSAVRERQIQQLMYAARVGSQTTGFFSEADIMQGLKVAAASGARPFGVANFLAMAPSIAQFMDVMGRYKGESTDQSARQAMQLSHMLQAYSAPEISSALNSVAMLAMLQPDEMDRAIQSLSYIQPWGRILGGMSAPATMALQAAIDQSGIGKGRAGQRVGRFLQELIAKRTQFSQVFGFQSAFGPDGSLDLMKVMHQLGVDRQRWGLDRFRTVLSAEFGQVATPIAAMLGTPRAQWLYSQDIAALSGAARGGALGQIQNFMKQTPLGVEMSTLTELKNNIIDFGKFGLPAMTSFFSEANTIARGLDDFQHQHPTMVNDFFRGIGWLGATLIALGTASFGMSATGTVVKNVIGAARFFQALGTGRTALEAFRVATGAAALSDSALAAANYRAAAAGTAASTSLGSTGFLGGVRTATAALGPFVVALGAAFVAVKAYQSIKNFQQTQPGMAHWLSQHRGEYMKLLLDQAMGRPATDVVQDYMNSTDYLSGYMHNLRAPSSSRHITIHNRINLDGRRVGASVTRVQTRALPFAINSTGQSQGTSNWLNPFPQTVQPNTR